MPLLRSGLGNAPSKQRQIIFKGYGVLEPSLQCILGDQALAIVHAPNFKPDFELDCIDAFKHMRHRRIVCSKVALLSKTAKPFRNQAFLRIEVLSDSPFARKLQNSLYTNTRSAGVENQNEGKLVVMSSSGASGCSTPGASSINSEIDMSYRSESTTISRTGNLMGQTPSGCSTPDR